MRHCEGGLHTLNEPTRGRNKERVTVPPALDPTNDTNDTIFSSPRRNTLDEASCPYGNILAKNQQEPRRNAPEVGEIGENDSEIRQVADSIIGDIAAGRNIRIMRR